LQDEPKSTVAVAATGFPTLKADARRLNRRIAGPKKDIFNNTNREQRLREELAEEITRDNHPHQGHLQLGNGSHGLNDTLNRLSRFGGFIRGSLVIPLFDIQCPIFNVEQ